SSLVFARGRAVIQTDSIRYGADPTMHGYVAWDDAVKGPRPAVLVVHEWWGPGDYVRGRARMLAELGYVGFAIDLYGDGFEAKDAVDANQKMQAALGDLGDLRARFEAAMRAASALPLVDPSKISAVGYCFGGIVVLYMARQGL